MALFRLGSNIDPATLVRGDGVILRPAEPRDFEAWSQLREASRAFLTPWEPIWPVDDLTRAAFRRRLRTNAEEMDGDEAYPFLIFRDDETLVGGLTVGQVRRGVSQTATLGYWMGARHAGQGHMSRAVRAAARFAFGALRLHRLEAACLAHNDASIRVLTATGFQREGVARSYLRINGTWQDHLLFALIETDAVPGARAR